MSGDLLATAVAAAEAGATIVRRSFRQGNLEIREKGDNDFVTNVDRESEQAILDTVLGHFPDHRILAEESGSARGGRGDVEWLIDPLDGTTNYLRGLPVYSVSVACRRGAQLLAAAIADPEGGNLFTAAAGKGAFWNGRPLRVSERADLAGAFLATGYPFRALPTLDVYLAIFRDVFAECQGIRRCGSAALDLAYTAAGVYDGFFEFRLAPWDVAAGILLIREAGGVATDLDGGEEFWASGNLIAGTPGVQRSLRATAQRHASEASIERLQPIGRPAEVGGSQV